MEITKKYDTKLDSDCNILKSALAICYSAIPSIPNVHYPRENLAEQFKADIVHNLKAINTLVNLLEHRVLPLGVPNHKRASFVAYVLMSEFIEKSRDFLNPDYEVAQYVHDKYVKWQNSVHASVESILEHNF